MHPITPAPLNLDPPSLSQRFIQSLLKIRQLAIKSCLGTNDAIRKDQAGLSWDNDARQLGDRLVGHVRAVHMHEGEARPGRTGTVILRICGCVSSLLSVTLCRLSIGI